MTAPRPLALLALATLTLSGLGCRWLPSETTLASFRWWNRGHAIELHTTTSGLPSDEQLTGRLTIKQWVGRAQDETSLTNAAAARVESERAVDGWRYVVGEPDVWFGKIDGTYVLASTVLAKEDAFRALESLAS